MHIYVFACFFFIPHFYLSYESPSPPSHPRRVVTKRPQPSPAPDPIPLPALNDRSNGFPEPVIFGGGAFRGGGIQKVLNTFEKGTTKKILRPSAGPLIRALFGGGDEVKRLTGSSDASSRGCAGGTSRTATKGRWRSPAVRSSSSNSSVAGPLRFLALFNRLSI